MNRGRLKTLIKILEHVRDEGEPFDMGVWTRAKTTREARCGTPACALGHAVMHDPFKRAGLRWEIQNRRLDGPELIPVYKGQTRIMAAGKFFGISYDDAERLFNPSEYKDHYPLITPQQVIARIRTILRRDEKARK